MKVFLDLVKQFEKQKEELKKTSIALDDAMKLLGVGSHFQDPDTGVVYEIVVPNGTFVEFHKVAYHRTKTKDEKQGTLSMSRAKELGYTI